MNIIFDKSNIELLRERYTVLELDTVMQPKMVEPLTLYAVIELTNIGDIATLNFFKELHEEFIVEYKSGNWQRAIELATSLHEQFNGELTEFYDLVIDFCQESVKVNRSWDGIRHTVPNE